jgi:ABC-type lipoprotein export system ATPase subunit
MDNTIRVAELLTQLGQELGLTVVVATHDVEVAARMRSVYRIRGGRVDVADGVGLR